MKKLTALKRKRLEDPRELTQEQVGAALGIHPRYYTEIENGTKRPSLTLMVKIARYWGMPVDELIVAFEFKESSNEAATRMT